MIQGPIPKTANAIVIRLFGNFLQSQQRDECLLKHVLGFRVGKTEGASIQNQFSCLGTIESLTPRRC